MGRGRGDAWPIQAPEVAENQFRRMMEVSGDMRLQHLWRELAAIRPPEMAEQRSSKITANDVAELLKAGIIKRSSAAFATAIAFTVPEEAKRRRRFILWPAIFNETFRYEPEIKLKTVEQVIAEVLDSPIERLAARVFDIRSAFFQMPVPAAWAAYLVFEHDGLLYEMSRVPMGATVSPELQQRLSLFLAESAASQSDVVYTVHIDNFRFLGPPDQVDVISERFTSICQDYGVTLNAEGVNTEFLGMDFNYTEKTVGLSARFVGKLRQLFGGAGVPRSMTVKELQALMGCLFFAAEVLALPVYEYYYGIKQYRKVAKLITKEFLGDTDTITLWEAAWHDLRRWHAGAVENPRRAAAKRGDDCSSVLFTDASDFGWAAVLCRRGKVFVKTGAWRSSRFWRTPTYLPHINQRELYAVMAAGDWMDSLGLATGEINLRVDSKVVVGVLRRRRSASYWLNNHIRRCGLQWRTVEWVASEANMADLPSRGQRLDPVAMSDN